MQKRLYRLTGVLLSLFILLTAFESNALSASYYSEAFSRLEVTRGMDIDSNRIPEIAKGLTDFLKTGAGLNETVTTDAGTEPFYSEKERHHMSDVYKLFQLLRTVIIILGIASAIGLIYTFMPNHQRYTHTVMRRLSHLFMSTVVTSLIVLFVLGVLYSTGFDAAFVGFHKLFFTNDLWILNPVTDRLIQLMPIDFFIGFTRDWLLRVALINGVLLLFAVLSRAFLRRAPLK